MLKSENSFVLFCFSKIKELNLPQIYKIKEKADVKTMRKNIKMVLENQKAPLESTALSAGEKKRLFAVLERYGATQSFSYERFFKIGFEQWELDGIDFLKAQFLLEHEHEILDGDMKVFSKDDIKKIIDEKGSFYATISLVPKLRARFNEFCRPLGLGTNSVLKHFPIDDWKPFQREGIVHLVEAHAKDIFDEEGDEEE